MSAEDLTRSERRTGRAILLQAQCCNALLSITIWTMRSFWRSEPKSEIYCVAATGKKALNQPPDAPSTQREPSEAGEESENDQEPHGGKQPHRHADAPRPNEPAVGTGTAMFLVLQFP